MADVSTLLSCPECSMEWSYMADCHRCEGTGVDVASGEPCTNHSDAFNDQTGRFDGECTPHCCKNGRIGPFRRLVGVQYDYTSPEHYDGVSEWMCPGCGARWGRWSGRRLGDKEAEPRFGQPREAQAA